LDTGHACVILNVAGKVGADDTKPENSITVFAQFNSTSRFSETIPIDADMFEMWSDISQYDDYVDLPMLRCKVVLTDRSTNQGIHETS